MVFAVGEIIEILISSVAITYLFKDFLPMRTSEEEKWKIAAMIAIPSLVLHELGHKFVALFYGLNATYHANYSGLFIGMVLKYFNFPLFFVPAYVSFSGLGATSQSLAIIALSGPLLNLILFLTAKTLLDQNKGNSRQQVILYFTKEVNKWLLLLNLLPLPGVDGYQAIKYLAASF